MPVPTDPSSAAPLSPTDWHVLMALTSADLHGYGIMKAVEEDSGGAVSAEVGSLYRILSRLMGDGFVAEVDAPEDAPAETRGRPRRYYSLTEAGREAVRRESLRLTAAVELARERQVLPRATS